MDLLAWVNTLNSLISMQQILFFLRIFSHLHGLLEPTRLFIFGEISIYTIIRTFTFTYFGGNSQLQDHFEQF